MRKTTPILLLLVAGGLTGCPGNNTNRDTGTVTPGNDSGVDAAVVPGVDSGMDAGSVPATDVPLASVVNAAATDHPADGTTVHVTGSLVALTTRLYASQSDPPANRCLYTMWVGSPAGGDHSGILVIETFEAPAGECFSAAPHVLPNSVRIGDTITNLTGRFINFCPGGGSCPPNTSQEIDVTNGTFTVGGAGTAPTATTVTIADVTGMGLTYGPRALTLQGAVVRLDNLVMRVAPVPGAAGNNNIMTVEAMGMGTPTMPIRVAAYPGVTCQRAELMTTSRWPVGASIGSVTGVLQYSFGQWIVQVRQDSDIPMVPCTVDAGTSMADAGP